MPTWILRLLCAWHGHAWILQRTEHRLWLRCLVCGRETPGFTIR